MFRKRIWTRHRLPCGAKRCGTGPGRRRSRSWLSVGFGQIEPGRAAIHNNQPTPPPWDSPCGDAEQPAKGICHAKRMRENGVRVKSSVDASRRDSSRTRQNEGFKSSSARANLLQHEQIFFSTSKSSSARANLLKNRSFCRRWSFPSSHFWMVNFPAINF